MEDLLPVLQLPNPLSIDFDLELKRGASGNKNNGLQSSHNLICSESSSAIKSSVRFDPFEYYEFPTITIGNVGTEHIDVLLRKSRNISQSPAGNDHIPPPPSKPLEWIWTCHLCHHRYPLGATRRCLIDGHYYCSGDASVTVQRNVKRKKKGISCSSEFDYVGWKDWGDWRQLYLSLDSQHPSAQRSTEKMTSTITSNTHGPRGCEDCQYPSECRYEKLDKPVTTNVSIHLTEHAEPPLLTSNNSHSDSNSDPKDIDVEMTGVVSPTSPAVWHPAAQSGATASSSLTECLKKTALTLIPEATQSCEATDPAEATTCSVEQILISKEIVREPTSSADNDDDPGTKWRRIESKERQDKKEKVKTSSTLLTTSGDTKRFYSSWDM